VWAQCTDTGLWAKGRIERLSEQGFLKGPGGLHHSVAWEKPCRRSCAACVGTSEVSIWCLQPRVGTEEPKLLPAHEPGGDPKEREWRRWTKDFIRHLPPRAAVEPRSPTPLLEAGVDGAGSGAPDAALGGAAGGAPARVAECGGQEGDAPGGAPARVAECGGQEGDAASDSDLEIVEELCTASAVIDMTEDAD
jgi:hypothetical protein